MNYRIQSAINTSIREGRTVILWETVDTQEWVNLVNGLAEVAEDWTETDAGGSTEQNIRVREYWGTDENGDEWRVHVKFENR